MADANLLKALSVEGELQDVVLFGRVRCVITKHPVINGLNFDGCMPSILDVYAIKCLSTDYFHENGSYAVKSVYFTKGSLLIALDNPDLLGQDVKVYGRSAGKGSKVKKGKASKKSGEGLYAFCFSKDSSGKWKVVPNKTVSLLSSDSEIKGTSLEDFMVALVQSGEEIIEYPVSLDCIQEFTIEGYEEASEEYMQENKITFSDSSEKIDLSKVPMSLVNHLTVCDLPENYTDIMEDLDKHAADRVKYVRSLTDFSKSVYMEEMSDDFSPSEYGYSGSYDKFMSFDSIMETVKSNFIEGICRNMDAFVLGSKVRGSKYLESFFNAAINFSSEDGTSDKSGSDIVNAMVGEVRSNYSLLYNGVGSQYASKLKIYNNSVLFFLSVISACSSIGYERLLWAYSSCSRQFKMDAKGFAWVLCRYPYLLGLLCGFPLEMCDVMYYAFSKSNKGYLASENREMKKILVFLNRLRDELNNNTYIEPRVLYGNRTSVYNSKVLGYVANYNFPESLPYVSSMRVICRGISDVTIDNIEEFNCPNFYSKKLSSFLEFKGILNDVDGMIALEVDLEKEFYIFNILRNKGEASTGITREEILNTVNEFEAEKGFTLEPLQRDGVDLCLYKSAVLSGCAGSGKTTVSDCFAKQLEKLGEEYKLIYIAPTGKACRRMAEVIGGTVRTIHSQFRLGIGEDASFVSTVGARKLNSSDDDKIKIYICDEMGMCTTSLLYEIVRCLKKEDLIYFLGDIKQLPPIGKGFPFKYLMDILPCVELGVSKRAVSTSEVNYNVSLLNNVSDGFIQELYYDDKTFICRECDNPAIPATLKRVWSGFMGGTLNGNSYIEDEIQVICPYASEKFLSSTTRLNPLLQEMLRSEDKLLFTYIDGSKFYDNDRVIHTNSNKSGRLRYVETYPNQFKEVATLGVVNGELGKVVGIVRSDYCKFTPYSSDDVYTGKGVYSGLNAEELKSIVETREEKEDIAEGLPEYNSDKYYFVKVSVWDVELKKNVLVLYTGRVRNMADEVGICLDGGGLGDLQLAYALTTHKMQGSQSRVVILPFESSCNPNFVNRNMLNTMITRSQEVVCCVGTIMGSDSPINVGRRHVSEVPSNNLFNILV